MRTNHTIAVLPFVNLGKHLDDDYFSDGITEEIINALAKISDLRVTSRTSSFYFKGKNMTIQAIGKALKVNTVLEGSVRRSGNTVRITAQLIDAEHDFHFWSETWDRQLDNIFEVQDEISICIADKLRESLGHIEIQSHLVQKQTSNLKAYDEVLQAKFHFNKWNPDDMHVAISLYQQALETDPNYAGAMLGLADAYSFMATTGFMPHEDAWTEAAKLIYQAQTIDDGLPELYYQLAQLAFFIECDYAKTFDLIRKAIELKNNYAEAQQFAAFLHLLAGHNKAAYQHLETALNLNPLSMETRFFNGYYHYMTENYQTAIKLLDECLIDNPKNIPALTVKMYCLIKTQQADAVLSTINTFPESKQIESERVGLQALAYAIKGQQVNLDKHIEILNQQAQAKDGFRAFTYLLLIYGYTGQVNKAFEWINTAIDQKSSLLLIHFSDPLVAPIKTDPRYTSLHQSLFKTLIPPQKSSPPLLSKTAIVKLTETLDTLMVTDKLYLDPDLNLRTLAKHLNINANQLSWLLNQTLSKNFNVYINQFRIEEFKRLALSPNHSNLTIMALAYDSGFNSKTAFNTYFKKETGLTPKAFIKQNKMS